MGDGDYTGVADFATAETDGPLLEGKNRYRAGRVIDHDISSGKYFSTIQYTGSETEGFSISVELAASQALGYFRIDNRQDDSKIDGSWPQDWLLNAEFWAGTGTSGSTRYGYLCETLLKSQHKRNKSPTDAKIYWVNCNGYTGTSFTIKQSNGLTDRYLTLEEISLCDDPL